MHSNSKTILSAILILLLSPISLFSQNKDTVTLVDKEVTVTSYTDKEVIINGKTDLHITASVTPLKNSVIDLNSDDSWVIFENIRPNVVIDSFLRYIYVKGQLAVKGTNARISIYKQGTVVIPHSSTFQPLKVYTGQNYIGDSTSYSLFTFYTSLGAFDNKIQSFKLKKGYMVTLATKSDGTGYSRVFIADKDDLIVPVMPDLLSGAVSFIRVFSWEYTSKKGWAGSNFNEYSKIKATWRYDWSAGGSTTNYVEYVPIRQKLNWPGFAEINGKQNITHVLGLNEPDHGEQHKDDNGGNPVTVTQALAQMPDMMKTGLRIGSPACTGESWIYQFIDSCKAHNYRVDFVAWHAYWGGKSPSSWYTDLKRIHETTGRPIWITEWNNGANWTTETWPDNTRPLALTAANAAKQLSDLTKILQVLDTAHFIERYSIYNWVEDARAMTLADTLTPAGKYYSNNNSVLALNKVNEVIPTWGFSKPSLLPIFNAGASLTFLSTDPNTDYNKGYILERKVDAGSFVKIQDTSLLNVKYTENFNLEAYKRVRYRLQTKLMNGSVTDYSGEVGFDVTEGVDIQTGKLSFSNIGWNNVMFKKAYTTAIPVMIFGSPTNNNFTVLMSNRVKQVNAYRFSFQFAPWKYQNISTLSKDETIPYLIMSAGSYDFGGLKAVADKATIAPSWTQVTFAVPFDTIPVVFATQITSSSTFATGVRVRNVTKTGFQAKIQKESAVYTSPASETVSFFAITPGTGVIDNKTIVVGKTTGAPVTSSYYMINYGVTIDNPIFISQFQTCNDDTVTACMRVQSIYNTYARVFKQREKSLTYTAIANEDAGWMVINPISNTVDNKIVKNSQLRFYPNPVSDCLYLENANNKTKVYIYNMVGNLVKQEIVNNGKIYVDDLKPGYYIIKTSDNFMNKFVKL